MIKNSKIEIGKTPAEDGEGPCEKIVEGSPLKSGTCKGNKSFEKIAGVLDNVSSENIKKCREKPEKTCSCTTSGFHRLWPRLEMSGLAMAMPSIEYIFRSTG
jgi:hypothetical protein